MGRFRLMKSALACFTLITGSAFAAANFPAPKSACLTCHEGIEPFVAHDTQMAQQIYALGAGAWAIQTVASCATAVTQRS